MLTFNLIEGNVRIVGRGTASNNPLHVQVSNFSALNSTDLISGDGSGDKATINASKELLVLDTGANAKLTTVDTKLGDIDTQLTTLNAKDFATATLQGVTNTALGTIDTSLGVIDASIGIGNGKLGTEATVLTVALPAGATGIMGHLSAIWNLANSVTATDGLKIKLDGAPITNYAAAPGGSGALGVLTNIKQSLKDRRLNPDQLIIRRSGTVNTNATTPTLISAASTALSGYPANTAGRTGYTVPGGKVYWLEAIRLSLSNPPAGKHAQLDIDIINNTGDVLVERFTVSLYSSSILTDAIIFAEPYAVPAGHRVEMKIHTSGNTALSYIASHAGIEEDA